MSDPSPTFIAQAIDGRVSPTEIDDFVDRWHEQQGGDQLHDYLGLTAAEYALWLVEPDMLDAIVKARANGFPLPAMVSDMMVRGGTSAPNVRSERLERWLAEHAAPR